MSAIRDKILKTDDYTRETVEVPEWDITVEVRSMSSRTRARMLKVAADGTEIDVEKFYPAVIVATCFDADSGEQVFTDDDVEQLAEKHAGVIDRLGQAGLRVSGMLPEAVEEGKDVSSLSPG